jgi:hypothetical protein
MTKYVVQLKSGDKSHNVDVWVYHKLFNTESEANDLGISFCKNAEEELIKLNYDYEYEDTHLFLRVGEDEWVLNSGYVVFPIETE